ncbi:molybdate ABC transporter substrate-binding protein [Propionibacteriaceae bacterium G1746]|uniref:molybdate ABC transporter substrate-binding protein n=1 Tax=Aestuariimicrobium sp. G57 TaxID=3418485 RepID=UPI003C141F6C
MTSCSTTDDASATSGITVFAAASLKASFEDLGAQFEAANPGSKVTFSFLGSQSLVDQLANGARADVLATADQKSMTSATDKSLVTTPKLFASNTLVLITPADNPGRITGLDGSLTGKKLVICDAAVPCGNATNTLAQQLGVTLAPVSKEQKVSDVVTKVTSGEADAGIVYATDAAAVSEKVKAIQIPGAEQVVNKYPIALTAAAGQAALGRKFIDFVLSDAGPATLQKYGFAKP